MNVELRRIADLAEQVRGVSYSKADASLEPLEGFVPVLRAGNIAENGLEFDDLVYVPEGKVKSKQLVRVNDIVIAASSGSLDVVGKAARAVNDFHGGFGAFCKVLRPGKDIEPSYFAHYFKTHQYRKKVSNLAAGANINNLRNGDLDELLIPVPPLEEQKRIAKILDAADALRTKRRESLAQFDALLQSTFLDLFGDPVSNPKNWDVREFGECIKAGPTNGISKTKDFIGHGFPILDNKGLYRSIYADFAEHRLIQLSQKELEKYRLRDGDVIINRVSVTPDGVGLPVLVRDAPRDCVFESNMMRVVPDEKIVDPTYLVFCLRTKGMRLRTINAANLANQASINQAGLRSIRIIIPPITLQHQFSDAVQAVENLKVRVSEYNAELDALFCSLQKLAFSGEL